MRKALVLAVLAVCFLILLAPGAQAGPLRNLFARVTGRGCGGGCPCQPASRPAPQSCPSCPGATASCGPRGCGSPTPAPSPPGSGCGPTGCRVPGPSTCGPFGCPGR